jgi:alpha-1,2-mannosyltransferase
MAQGVIDGTMLPSARSTVRLHVVGRLGLALAASTLLALVTWTTVRPGSHVTDFATFYDGGKHVLHGLSPYPLLSSLPHAADPKVFAPFVYPPPLAFAIVPLSVLPFAIANGLFFVLAVAAAFLALRLLGVRDWPCYAAAFASPVMLASSANGTISSFLLLAVAVAWRYREHSGRLAAAIASAVVAKLFLWPLLIWLVLTRRYRAAALSAAAGVVVTLAAWAALGFAGLRDYPQLLSRLSELTGVNSYSLYALERAAGFPSWASQVGLLAVAAVALRAVRGASDERLFITAVGLGLVLTPIMWQHYLVLLFVPIAIARPRMSGLWLLPLLFWLDPSSWSAGDPARIAPVLCLSAALLVTSLRVAR